MSSPMKMTFDRDTRKRRKRTKFLGRNNNRPKDAQYERLRIVGQSSTPLPLTFRTTLRYYEQVSLASATPYIYVFRANSGYDPNQTGTGAQPAGWDNLLTFYDAHFSPGSRIVITVINSSTTPVQFGVAPTISASGLASFDQLKIYNRGAVFGFVDGTTRGSSSVKSIAKSVSVLSFYGQPYDRDFQARGQATPSRQLFWTIAFQSSDQTTALNINFQVEILYDYIFSDPIPVFLS